MLTCNRILLASDFSASADAALLYAAAWARHTHARLLMLHVLDTRVAALPRWTDVFRSTEAFAAMEAAATSALERLQGHPALAGLHVDMVMQHGNPRERIIDAAVEADLVVMGTRGQSRRGGGGAGKVAQYVAHGSPTPVLFVPEGGGQAGLPEAGSTRLPWRHIILALHFAQYAPQAITLAQELAMACQATLQVLQVIEPDKITSYPLEAGAGLYHNLEAMKILLHKRLADIVGDIPEGPPVERLMQEGNAAAVICRESAVRHADLVVMSAHAYGVVQKFFTVSTVDTVLTQALCPLLAVPIPRSGSSTCVAL
jgi:nucleotide-binding universal stress UspA family protein